MTVKSLNKSSVKEILALYNGNFNDGWTESMLNSGFDGGRLKALGVYDCDKLIGLITFSLSLDDADIEGVVVDRLYRKKGIGALLMQSAHEFILESKIKTVLLEVRESNISAISLYKKFGYEQISLRKKYYDDGENALVFKKEL